MSGMHSALNSKRVKPQTYLPKAAFFFLSKGTIISSVSLKEGEVHEKGQTAQSPAAESFTNQWRKDEDGRKVAVSTAEFRRDSRYIFVLEIPRRDALLK